MERTIYDRVVLIGVDGAGTFFREAVTQNLNRIFDSGAISFDVLTSEPTISAECWGSMLHGVRPEIHRLTNGIVSTTKYDNQSEFPSVFRVIRENMPDAAMASFCNWNPINIGIIEDELDVHKDSAADEVLTDKICEYIAANDPVLLFVQFDEVDGAGHANGYGTPGHLTQITKTDNYIERIFRAYEERDFIDNTLFIVAADHGGTPGGSHGGSSDAEKYVMVAVSGKTVAAGNIVDMEIRDTASVILYALGLDGSQPDTWTSRVPSGVFEGVNAVDRPIYTIDYTIGHRIHKSGSAPDTGISGVLDSSKILAFLPFDGNCDNTQGEFLTASTGKLYYVEGYYGEGLKTDDGYVTLKDFKPGISNFTIAVWFKTGGVGGDPSLCSNKNWESGLNEGFILSLRPGDVKFNLGNGKARMDLECPLPPDFRDGWVHVILSVDRDKNIVTIYYDFQKAVEMEITPELAEASFDGLKSFNIGQDGTGRYASPLSAILDEFILYDGVINDREIESLADYYKEP
jgi:hypothetical protein